MRGEVENLPVGVEDVLGAVAVVDVPVQDRYAPQPARAGVLGGDGGVVEEAESHPVARARVMPRRPGYGEGRRARQGALDRPDCGPAGEERRLPGVLVEAGVRIEVAAARFR